MALRVWYQDQAEYYFVCEICYQLHRDKQWSGNTKYYGRSWPAKRDEIEVAARRKRSCEFCGPRGNGGPT